MTWSNDKTQFSLKFNWSKLCDKKMTNFKWKKKKNEKYFNKITVKNAKRGDCFIQQQITRILYYKGSWSLQLHAQNTYVIKCHRHYFWTTWRNPFELVSMGFILFCDFIIFIQIIGVFWWLLYEAPVCSPFSSNFSSIHTVCSLLMYKLWHTEKYKWLRHQNNVITNAFYENTLIGKFNIKYW